MRITRDWLLALAAMALPTFVILAWLSPMIKLQMFCASGEACVREWVSALGAYFAVAAAYFTIREMVRQRETALEVQRENVELSVSASAAQARRALNKLKRVGWTCDLIGSLGFDQQLDDRQPWTYDPKFSQFVRLAKNLTTYLNAPDLVKAEGLVSLQRTSSEVAEQLSHALSEHAEMVDKSAVEGAWNLQIFQGRQAAILLNVVEAKRYHDEARLALVGYAEKWEARVNGVHSAASR